MRPSLRIGALAAAVLLVAAPVHAQRTVGVQPTGSPFRDLEHKDDLTFFGGLAGGRDRVGAAPNGGPAIGVRYDLHVSGPAAFMSRLVVQLSDRDVLRTTGVPPAPRIARTVSQPLYLADIGVTLNLTGRKSWRNVVPSINGSLGLASDFRAASDSSAYRFGNRFMLQAGAGIKWHARGRWTVRADLSNYFYNISYPQSFRILQPTAPEQAILPITDGLTGWTRNTMLTVGVVRHFRR